MKYSAVIALSVIAAVAVAQTPFHPGGLIVPRRVAASSGWTPTNETVLGWWDATTIAQGNDTDVDIWIPRYGANMVSPNPGDQSPQYKTAVQNSLSIVRFMNDPTTSQPGRLQATNQANNVKPFTVALVINRTSVANSGIIVGGTATGGLSVDFDQASGTIRIVDQAQALIGTCPFPTNVFVAAVCTYDASGNYAFYTNGVNGTSGTTDRAFTGGQLKFGTDTGAGIPLRADVGDIILDDVVWDATIRSNFFVWADNKWDLSY